MKGEKKKSLAWFDNSGTNVKRGIRIGAERTHSREKTKEKKERKGSNNNTKTIKIPFRHERDSSEQGPLRPRMAVMSIQNGSAGFLPCHSQITVHC